MENSKIVKTKELTLSQFINQNDKLLSALGVFAALVALTKSSSNWLLNAISFILIGGLILLWYEIWLKIRKKISSRLELFRYVLLWGGVGFVLYWVYEFRGTWHLVLWAPATLALFAFFLWTIKPIVSRIPLTSNIFGINRAVRKNYQKIAGSISIIILILISLYFGILISSGTNVFFDLIKLQFGQ